MVARCTHHFLEWVVLAAWASNMGRLPKYRSRDVQTPVGGSTLGTTSCVTVVHYESHIRKVSLLSLFPVKSRKGRSSVTDLLSLLKKYLNFIAWKFSLSNQKIFGLENETNEVILEVKQRFKYLNKGLELWRSRKFSPTTTFGFTLLKKKPKTGSPNKHFSLFFKNCIFFKT